MSYYVNAYEISRAYGGPEEGGWWYTVGTPIECIGPFGNRAVAEKWLKEQKDWLYPYRTPVAAVGGGYKMGNTSMDGCDPNGDGDDNYLTIGGIWGDSELKVCIEDNPAEPFPKTRPYYE